MKITLQERQSSRLCAGFLTIAALHGHQVAVGDCHSAFHESPMPSRSEPVHVEAALEAVGLF